MKAAPIVRVITIGGSHGMAGRILLAPAWAYGCDESAAPSLGVIHVISISGGKDSQATALLARKRFPRARIVGITCDTDNEHPLTYEHIEYLRGALGIEIHVLKADFTERMKVKREYIARDQRTRRQYERRPKIGRPR